jgi:hypothetical protein
MDDATFVLLSILFLAIVGGIIISVGCFVHSLYDEED